MATFMTGNDLEPSANGETNPFHKRIPEANTVHVLVTGIRKELPARLVFGQEAIQHREADTRCGPNLRWCGSTLCLRRRLHKAADKPASKPPGNNLRHRRIRPF